MKIDRNKIADYLEDQFNKKQVYECMPENDEGYNYIPRDNLLKIVDGLIPMVKTMIKNKVKSL